MRAALVATAVASFAMRGIAGAADVVPVRVIPSIAGPQCRLPQLSMRLTQRDRAGAALRLTATNRGRPCLIAGRVQIAFYDRAGDHTAYTTKPMWLHDTFEPIVRLARGERATADITSSDEAGRSPLGFLFDGRLVGCVRPTSMTIVLARGEVPLHLPVPPATRFCPLPNWGGLYYLPGHWEPRPPT
jgi:hypothetical protein